MSVISCSLPLLVLLLKYLLFLSLASYHGSDGAHSYSTEPKFSTSSMKGPLVGEAGEIVVWQVVEGSCRTCDGGLVLQLGFNTVWGSGALD